MMTATDKMPASRVGRLRTLEEARLYKNKFQKAMETTNEAVDVFRKADNTPEDGNTEPGVVVLSDYKVSGSPFRYSGTYRKTDEGSTLKAELSRGGGSPEAIFRDDSKERVWDYGVKRVVENKATGILTVHEYLNKPRETANDLESPEPPVEINTLEEKLTSVFKSSGQRCEVVGCFSLDEMGNFESSEQLKASRLRNTIDAQLENYRQEFLNLDNGKNDWNGDAGYVVFDGPYKATPSILHGVLSNELGFGPEISGTAFTRTTDEEGNKEFEGLLPFLKEHTDTQTLALFGNLAYIEDRLSGMVTVYGGRGYYL